MGIINTNKDQYIQVDAAGTKKQIGYIELGVINQRRNATGITGRGFKTKEDADAKNAVPYHTLNFGVAQTDFTQANFQEAVYAHVIPQLPAGFKVEETEEA